MIPPPPRARPRSALASRFLDRFTAVPQQHSRQGRHKKSHARKVLGCLLLLRPLPFRFFRGLILFAIGEYQSWFVPRFGYGYLCSQSKTVAFSFLLPRSILVQRAYLSLTRMHFVLAIVCMPVTTENRRGGTYGWIDGWMHF